MAPRRNRGPAKRRTSSKAGKAKKKRVQEFAGIQLLRTLTNLAFYTKLPKPESGEANNTWLSKLWQYGVMAFKLAVSLLAVGEDGAVSAPTGATQAIALTPDTLVYSSPVTGWRSFVVHDGQKVETFHSQSFGYRQIKVRTVSARITPGAILKERAGRVSAVIIPLTWAESDKIQRGNLDDYASYRFLDIVKMPGARTVEAPRPITLSWTPHTADWGDEWLRVGQQETPSAGAIPPGGRPIAVLLIGYQDLAAPKPTVDTLYSADEALYNVDIRASVSCREYGDSWLRPVHRTLQNPDTVSVSVVGAHGSWDVPLDAFRVKGDTLLMAPEYVTDEVTRALTNPLPYAVGLGEPAAPALGSQPSPATLLGWMKL